MKDQYKRLAMNRVIITVLLILLQVVWFVFALVKLTEYVSWITTVFTVLSIIMVLYIIGKDDNSAYKIGWIVLIMVLPLFGGLFYLFYGDKKPSRKMRRRLSAQHEQYRKYLTEAGASSVRAQEEYPRAAGSFRYVQKVSDFPAYTNTRVKYYPSGEEMFTDMIEDLKSARHYIFLEYFIVSEGKMWETILEILKKKAAEGVDVRMIYDDMGCLTTVPSGFVIRLEQAHIRCIPFNPVVPLVSLVMNHRDHRKIVSIDGNVAYNGGTNFADEYINVEERFGYWKDAAVRLEGAAVWNFTVMFLNFWNSFRPMEEDYRPFRPTVQAAADGVVQPYSDSPLDEERLAESVYRDILDQAQDYVYIFTPYLAIGEDLLNSLKLAAKRGVDVRLVLPGIPDKKIVFRLSRSYYLPLLRAGVKVYEFTPGFIHSKCYVSDDRIAVVGSINMDYRSLYLHFECGTLLMGGSQVAAVRADAEQTFGQCHRITLDDCRTSLLGTLLDDVLRLVSPLL